MEGYVDHLDLEHTIMKYNKTLTVIESQHAARNGLGQNSAQTATYFVSESPQDMVCNAMSFEYKRFRRQLVNDMGPPKVDSFEFLFEFLADYIDKSDHTRKFNN